jgi:hypothetical protein
MRASIRPVTVSIPLGVLFGCTLFAQSYSPMYAPASGNLQQWVCVYYDTNVPIPGAVWFIDYYNTGYFSGTNDHLHYGSVAPATQYVPSSGSADGYGNFSFSVYPTLIGHAEFYSVACGPPEGEATEATQEYAVGYNDIYWVSVPGTLYQVGGNTSGHGDNTGDHWMQTTPAYGIYYTALAYLSAYNPGQQVCVNDMALPFGGKFDYMDNWTSPHMAHDIGSAVDLAVNAGQCPSSYVISNPAAFVNLAVSMFGAVGGGVSYYNSTDIHINFVDPSTYPH